MIAMLHQQSMTGVGLAQRGFNMPSSCIRLHLQVAIVMLDSVDLSFSLVVWRAQTDL